MTAPDTGRVARPAILTVDDDPSVSRAVARDLRRQYGEGYRIVRAESGQQALEALREIKLRGEQVAVLLADYRMPGMSGIEFLEQAMDLFPNARRALLTAYADTDAAIQAINLVDVDHYLLKPWDPPEEKFYPVIDNELDQWKRSDHTPRPQTKLSAASPVAAVRMSRTRASGVASERRATARMPSSTATSRSRSANSVVTRTKRVWPQTWRARSCLISSSSSRSAIVSTTQSSPASRSLTSTTS